VALDAPRAASALKNDRVLVLLPRCCHWYSVVLGAIRLGMLPMPTVTVCTVSDLSYRIGRSEATHGTSSTAAAVSRACQRVTAA